MNRLKCLFGFHDYEAHTEDFGEVPDLLGKMLVHASLIVRAKYKNGHYLEFWRKCSCCGKECPRSYQQDIYDLLEQPKREGEGGK